MTPAEGESSPSWRVPLGLIVLVILFVPIKVYTLPGSLPVNLELYRVVVALVLLGWLASLLVDPRVRLRPTRLDAPIALFLVAIVVSLLANPHRLAQVRGDALKSISFFLSYLAVFYLVAGTVRRSRDVDFLVRALAAGGAVVAAFAVLEASTGFNVFDHLHAALPFLQFHASAVPALFRGGGRRAYGSAQHPIALGAALCVLLPLAVYLATVHRRRRWWGAVGLIVLGLLATRSRTPIVMLGAEALVYAALRTREARRAWPALVPVVLIAYLAVPGTIRAVEHSFFPTGGLVEQQTNAFVGSGRLATLGPAFRHEFLPHPLVGEGFGTRVTTPDALVPVPNGPILDDEWLGVLLETGVFGTCVLAWLFLRGLRWLGGEARRDFSRRGWLLVAITASVAAYATGMFLYDAFSFVQVTFLLFLVLGLGASTALSSETEWAPAAALLNRRATVPASAAVPAGLAQTGGQLS